MRQTRISSGKALRSNGLELDVSVQGFRKTCDIQSKNLLSVKNIFVGYEILDGTLMSSEDISIIVSVFDIQLGSLDLTV